MYFIRLEKLFNVSRETVIRLKLHDYFCLYQKEMKLFHYIKNGINRHTLRSSIKLVNKYTANIKIQKLCHKDGE